MYTAFVYFFQYRVIANTWIQIQITNMNSDISDRVVIDILFLKWSLQVVFLLS